MTNLEDKRIVIAGDVGPGETISIGKNNVVNGKKLENPTLPAGAQIVEGEGLGDLAEQIRAKVAAKLAKAGISNDGSNAGGINIGGETKGGTIIQSDNMKVDTRTSAKKETSTVKATRTLPFKAGVKITDGNMNGVAFDGVWLLKVDGNGQPIKQNGQFVYEQQ